MELVRWLSVLVAVGILLFIAFRRHRQGQAILRGEDNLPEPSEAEIQAAKDSIRAKTVEAVVSSKRRAYRNLRIFVFLGCAMVLFLDGMPLSGYFIPLGQIMLGALGIMGIFALAGFIGTFVARGYQRRMHAWLDELEKDD